MRKGISDEKIDYLCKMIDDYREKLSQNQSQFEELLSLIRENLKNDSSQELNNILEQVKNNNDASNNNLISYIEDLKALQRNYKIQDEAISANLEKNIGKLKEEKNANNTRDESWI